MSNIPSSCRASCRVTLCLLFNILQIADVQLLSSRAKTQQPFDLLQHKLVQLMCICRSIHDLIAFGGQVSFLSKDILRMLCGLGCLNFWREKLSKTNQPRADAERNE